MGVENRVVERRTYLCVIGAAGAAAGCGDGGAPVAPFSAGRVADHAVGVWKLYGAASAIVGRDAAGFFAYSATCTHQSAALDFREPAACVAPVGCTAVSTTGNTRCINHGSTFDGNGGNGGGPAVVPLGSRRHGRIGRCRLPVERRRATHDHCGGWGSA